MSSICDSAAKQPRLRDTARTDSPVRSGFGFIIHGNGRSSRFPIREDIRSGITAAQRDPVFVRLDPRLPRREHRTQPRVGPRERVLDVVPRRDVSLTVSPDRIVISCGGPLGSHPCSSSRIHCTRTGLPTACDISAASSGASSRLETTEAAGTLAIDEVDVLSARMPSSRARPLRVMNGA